MGSGIPRYFLAFDLGPSRGRACLGRLHADGLTIREISSFPTHAIHHAGALRWDISSLWRHLRQAMAEVSGTPLGGIGVGTWGGDAALLDQNGGLLDLPFHGRDSRTDGMIEAVTARVCRERIYATTGVAFHQTNTLYQLYATCMSSPGLVRAASAVLLMSDLVNHWLTGRTVAEYSNATTTQFLDVRTRSWATDLLTDLDLPAHLLAPLVDSGTIVGPLRKSLAPELATVSVIAPACHDIASAVAAISLDSETAFLKLDDGSTLGTEVAAPIITPQALDWNFSNAEGCCRTSILSTRLAGLSLLDACRQEWIERGRDITTEEMLVAAGQDREASASLIDPDHASFDRPSSVLAAIADFCAGSGQPAPTSDTRIIRTILESLALKYRLVLERLEALTDRRITTIRVVGAGTRIRVLNQFMADATGCTVIAGPGDATVLGNIAIQLLASGAVPSLAQARAVLDRSFQIERFLPRHHDSWNASYQRFLEILPAASLSRASRQSF